jgi:hypothetical protein
VGDGGGLAELIAAMVWLGLLGSDFAGFEQLFGWARTMAGICTDRKTGRGLVNYSCLARPQPWLGMVP